MIEVIVQELLHLKVPNHSSQHAKTQTDKWA